MTEKSTNAGGVLSLPAFRRLWAANGLRYSASEVAGFALPITAVVLLHAGPLAVSLIFACGRAGYLLFGLPAGAWIDRWNRKIVLICADACLALTFASVPAAYLLHVLTVDQMVAVALMESVAGAFFDIAHTSVLPQLMPKRDIADANARLQTSETAIQAVSPGIAGFLTQSVAAPLFYGFTALCHVGSVFMVRTIRVNPPTLAPLRAARVPRQSLRREIMVGIQISLQQPFLRLMIVQTSLFNLGVGILLAAMPIFLLRDVGLSPWLFGLQSSLGAIAGVVSSLVCPRLRRRQGEIRMTLLFAGLAPVALLFMPLAGVVRVAAVPFALIAAIGINFVIVGRSVAGAGLRARVTPNEFLGRVSAAYMVVTKGATMVGGLVAGVLADAFSTNAVMWIAVLEMVVPTVVLLQSPLRGQRHLPAEWEVREEQETDRGPVHTTATSGKESSVNKLEQAAADYAEQGFAIIRDVLPGELLAEADAHVRWLIAKYPGLSPEHFHHPLVRNDAFWVKLLSDPRLVDIAEFFLGPNLASFTAHYICKPPRTGQPVLWHQDGAYWKLAPMEALTVWVAIDESTVGNGCLQMIPGSHRLPLYEPSLRTDQPNMLYSATDEEIVAPLVAERGIVNIELGPGDVSIHHPNLLHCSGPNTSADRRCGLDLGYISTSTRILSDGLYLDPILVRGRPVDAVNYYRAFPKFAAGETIPFRDREAWNERVDQLNADIPLRPAIADEAPLDTTLRMFVRLKDGTVRR